MRIQYMHARIVTALFIGATALLAGCAGAGTKRVLFYTRSNVGVDISGTPPTFEATIARREGVLEPAFEGGQTLPVVASFRSDTEGLLRIFTGVAMTFATSEAALALAYKQGSKDPNSVNDYLNWQKPSNRNSMEQRASNPYDATVQASEGSLVWAAGRGSDEELNESIDALEKRRAALDAERDRVDGHEQAEAVSSKSARINVELQYLRAHRDAREAANALRKAEESLAEAPKGSPAAAQAKRAANDSQKKLSDATTRIARLRPEFDPESTSTPPKSAGSFGQIEVSKLQPPGKLSPLFFATDTALGLKVGFETNVPTSFVFGFNRKELALAPVTARKLDTGGYEVAMPSVLASVNSMATAEKDKAGLKYQQYFATGKAATYLALNPEVREAFSRQLLPAMPINELATSASVRMASYVYSQLTLIAATPGDRQETAQRLVDEIDLACGPVAADFEVYVLTTQQPTGGIALQRSLIAGLNGTNQENLTTYLTELDSSIERLQTLIKPYDKAGTTAANLDANHLVDGAGASTQLARLKRDLKVLSDRRKEVEAAANKRLAESGNPILRAREFILTPPK